MKYTLMSKPGTCIEFPDKYGRGMAKFIQEGIREGRHITLVAPDLPFFQDDFVLLESYGALQLETRDSPQWKKAHDQAYLRVIRFKIKGDRRISRVERDDLVGRIDQALVQL